MMDRTRLWKRGSRALALVLAGAMVASLGTDVASVTNVYAAESGTEYTCGKEEHEHTDECYETREVRELICDQKESEGTEGHTHTDDCYTEEQVQICGQEETDGSEGHHHSDDCYDEDGALICTEDESEAVEAHHHTDACYETQRRLTCTENESEGTEGHTHSDDCYKTTEKEVLICDKDEHTHTDECLDPEEEPASDHVANADYDKEWTEAAEQQLDTDKENEETKAQTLADLVSSQAGYTAQILDDDADDEDAEPLYSLYSNWYTNGDNSTKDWNTTFVFWALDQAGFETEKELDATSTALPIRSDIKAWVKALQAKEEATLEAEDAYYASLEDTDTDDTDAEDTEQIPEAHALSLYMDTENDGLSLTAGDILFLDLDQDGTADHVGVAASVDEDEDTGAANSVAVVIGDLDQETLEDLDDTNDALDSDNSDANVAAGIALPADDYDLDDDSDETREAYLESYITGYVPIAGYEQQLEAINPDDTEPDEPDGGSDEDDNAPGRIDLDLDKVSGITYTSRIKNSGDVSDAPIMMAATNDAATGVNMSSYVTDVHFYKRDGQRWLVATEFNTSDQVRGVISFESIYTSTIKNNGNKIYIDLPAGIDCSKFGDEVYDAYDGTTKSGTYQYVQNADGSYRIELTLSDDYVNAAGDTIGGNLQFEFYWDEKVYPKEDNYPVEIGNWDGEVKIIPDKKEEEDDKNANYWINKSASQVRYDDAGYAYIDYTVTLVVRKDMDAPINLKDVLTGKGFTYKNGEDDITISSANGHNAKVNFGSTYSEGTVSTQIQVRPESGNTVYADTYTINYTVKSTSPVTESSSTTPSEVSNTISVPDGGKNPITSETHTKTSKGTIDKQGNVVNGTTDATYIDYTVYLNAGGIISNLKEAARFSDTLPDTVDLVEGSVSVRQYDVTGTETDASKDGDIGSVAVNGRELTYSTPTGQYYYIITYRVKVKDSEIKPGEGLVVDNTGSSTGGIEGSDTESVTVKDNKLSKKFVDQHIGSDSDSNWTDTIKWTSTVNVSGSLEGYVYEDWGDLKSADETNYFAALSMSNEQRSKIVITDKNGNVVDSSKYEVEESDHKDTAWADGQSKEIANGLFKITFSADVTGPVTIAYETTADLSHYKVGDQLYFINRASLTKDGKTSTAYAQTDTKQYEQDAKQYIYKYGASAPYDNGNKGTIELEPGQTSIPWTIEVNRGRLIYKNITVTDRLGEDLTFLPDTFKVMVWQSDITSSCRWNYDETTRTLTVTIPKNLFSSTAASNKYSNPVTISFRTQLPDSYFEKDDITKTYSNTASTTVDGDIYDSTFDETVTRKVVGKNGTYDAATGALSYEIAINPDGSELNNGSALKLEDTLSVLDMANSWVLNQISLSSLELWTMDKTTDAVTGKVTIKAGTYIQDLSEVRTLDDLQTVGQYYYDNTTHKFTTYISDRQAYVLVARYQVEEEDGSAISGDIGLKNSVDLSGSDKWSAEDKDTKLTRDTSGKTHTNDNIVSVIKHDASDSDTKLVGAEFTLYRWDPDASEWVTVGTKETGANGSTSAFTGLTLKTLYKLSESKAPDGYVLDKTPTYFVVDKESNRLQAKATLPESIAGESEYNKDVVKVYTAKDDVTDSTGTVTKKNYANIRIDRYDQKDTTLVEPGSLRVIKKWKNSLGTDITDATKLASMPQVEVTLTKHVAKKTPVVTVKHGDNSGTVSVNPGGYIVFENVRWDRVNQGTFSWSCDDNAVTVQSQTYENSSNTYTYVVGPITKDCIITSEAFYWDSVYNKKTSTQGGTPVEGTDDTVIETVTLNQSNSWYYDWSNLERGDGISYSIEETSSIDGYTTTYKWNTTDVTDGGTFRFELSDPTGATKGDTFTITNTAEKTNVKVHKVWNDGSVDHSGDSITVHLLRGVVKDGQEITYARLDPDKTVTLNSSNGWTAAFTELPKEDEEGNEYVYSVEEDLVPKDYTVEVEKYTSGKPSWDVDDKTNTGNTTYYVVTNTKQYTMPETGGVGTLPYMLGGSAALISSMFAGCSMRRRRRDERRCD